MAEHDDRALTQAEAEAQRAVRALGRPTPDAAFRDRLREAFVTGDFTGMPASVKELPWFRPPAMTWIGSAAAVAAVIVVALVLNRGPEWRVTSVQGTGAVLVDGRPVSLSDPELLARAIRPGARIEVPQDAQVDLMIPGRLAIAVTAGTGFTLPPSPGRWFGRTVAASVNHGTIRITTSARFQGVWLTVDTPEAVVEVSGTTVAIICETEGTCVCVLEGEVLAGSPGGRLAGVTGGTRRYIFSDGRGPIEDVIRPGEREKLTSFRDRVGFGGV